VIYHEYGHHLVQTGGSGQCQYGEGMGDTLAMLILDDPCTGLGFFGDCVSCLRDADNNCQYSASSCSSCGGPCHSCGKLLSGCVWSVRNNLFVTEPTDYLTILSSIAVNAVMMHSGSSITSSITVDYLTLDDDNGNILDGTPHYAEINGGFTAHGLAGPDLALLGFEFPEGLPEMVAPAGGTTIPVDVVAINETPEPGTGKLFVDTGTGYIEHAMAESAPNEYDAVLPAAECGVTVAYYFSAETVGGGLQLWPPNAPGEVFTALSAESVGVDFDDDFETDQGWTVTNGGGLVDGPWGRGVPIPNSVCNRGNPGTDADGSGQCYVTDNSSANACNSDVDDGSTTLTSPIMDATQGEAYISYWRWYDNTAGDSPNQDIFEVEVSENGGTSWVDLETVGPSGSENAGGWFNRTFRVSDFVTPTSTFRIRFTASDTDPQSVVEAGVDGVQMLLVDCEGGGIPGDIDGNGVANWGS
jgi:hypothetical protein